MIAVWTRVVGAGMEGSGDMWEVFRKQFHGTWWLAEYWTCCQESVTVKSSTQSCDLVNLGTLQCYSERCQGHRRRGDELGEAELRVPKINGHV